MIHGSLKGGWLLFYWFQSWLWLQIGCYAEVNLFLVVLVQRIYCLFVFGKSSLLRSVLWRWADCLVGQDIWGNHIKIKPCNFFMYWDGELTKNPKTGLYFRTCEDGAGWHLIPYRISPRSEFFSQAYKNWHITWGINLGPDWPPLARGSKFHTITQPPGR